MSHSERTLGVLLIVVVSLSCGGVAWGQDFDVNVPAAYLIDAQTGQELFSKNANEAFHPASLVKVMTLLVALDAVGSGEVSLEDEVRTSTRAAAIGGSQVYLTQGEVRSLESLLRAVAIAGANDASIAVAEYVAGTEEAFVQRMNDRAQELGMVNSLFVNPHGLPPSTGTDDSWTSARDITRAARALVLTYPDVLEWTSVRVEQFREEPLFNLYNTNDLIGWYDGLDGLRTGYTSEAGYLLVATALRGDVRLISAVLAAQTQSERQEATRALLNYGFNRLQRLDVASEIVGQLEVRDGTPEKFNVRVEHPVRVLVPRASSAEVETQLVPSDVLSTPIQEGEEVGALIVRVNGEESMRVPIFAAEDVARAGAWERLWRSLSGIFR